MYCRYFGLREFPFSIAPNPRYLFMSQRHREALAHLLYGIDVAGGFVLLTGEVGTGKTTISRCLLEQLPDNTDVAFILNPYLDATDLLATICDELGIQDIEHKQSLKYLNERLYHFLLENHAQGRNTVLLIDEAQHLQYEVLETIRLLTNLETNTKKLLQIIFVGQPELNRMLAQPSLRQLAQRITARFHIEPLSLAETEAYIAHRLRVAGLPANQQPFSLSIIKSVHSVTGGIPRVINVLCDRMLLGTYAQDKTVIDRVTLRQAALEVLGKDPDKTEIKPLMLPVLAAGIAIVGLVSLSWWQWSTTLKPALVQNTLVAGLLDTAPESGPPRSQAPVEPLQEESNAWFYDEDQALNELLLALGLKERASANPCAAIQAKGLRCERQSVRNWSEFKDINRPSVLVLKTPANQTAYASLIGIENSLALLSISGEHKSIPLMELGEQWSGEFIFVWRPPEHFDQPISLGDRNPVVEWLAIRFAEMDGGFGVWSSEEFDTALAERVKLFQRENDLTENGIVGLRTLLRINDKLGVDRTLDTQYLAQTQPNEKG